MFEKVLIANRGEIALRVIRACKELGIAAAAIFSQADENSLHLRYADESYSLGPPSPHESYLNMEKIIDLAIKMGADAIHPGYGFLAENGSFAERCEKKGIRFIGPSSSTLKLTGDKVLCRSKLKEAGIPVVEGCDRPLTCEEDALDLAEELDWPILLKSIYGGGGRGIRVAHNRDELMEGFSTAKAEAEAACGDSGIYLEKYLENARHIEFQILGDLYGNLVHLGERECSIQRRYQKLIELSPSPVIDIERRTIIGEVAKKAAKVLGYTNAGTIEFIFDQKGNYYFIELNARLQVEHPVTELVTGIDLVKEQFKIASGEGLSYSQDEIQLDGCAIECRINAEDPYNDFTPSLGRVSSYHPPSGPGVRVDSALYNGYRVPVYYDSLISKLVTWGRDFEEARIRMKNALAEYQIQGVSTTIPLHQTIMGDEWFRHGILSTDFIVRRNIIERMRKGLEDTSTNLEEIAAAFAAVHITLKNGRRNRSVIRQKSRRLTNSWKAQMNDGHQVWGYGRFVEGL